MNIKGIVHNLIPLDFNKKVDLKKTRNHPDRDPQQGGAGNGQNPERHNFTETELKEAIQVLKDIPGVKANNLQIRVERLDQRFVVYIEDSTGKTVRRIADTELWILLKNRQPDSARGNLLNKAL